MLHDFSEEAVLQDFRVFACGTIRTWIAFVTEVTYFHGCRNCQTAKCEETGPFDGTGKFLFRDTGKKTSLSRDPGTGRGRINASFLASFHFHHWEQFGMAKKMM